MSRRSLSRTLAALTVSAVSLLILVAAVGAVRAAPGGTPAARVAAPLAGAPELAPLRKGEPKPAKLQDFPDLRDDWFYSLRTAGEHEISVADASRLRAEAAAEVLAMQSGPRVQGLGPQAFGGNWLAMGPDPIIQSGGAYLRAVSGRISALAVRSSPPYTIYLGAAQGGLWVSSTLTSKWLSLTDQLPTQAMGDIALAPSNEDIIYVGTGEGNLSGDSYFGDGVYKSVDGGKTFRHVGGSTINQSSVARVRVDPNDPNHVYVATARGRRGARGVTGPNPSPYGIYESVDGGETWIPRLTTTNQLRGATDLIMDPINPQLLYASFWSQGLVKSSDGGKTWQSLSGSFPIKADWASPTLNIRIALGISRPSASAKAVIYAGFEWIGLDGVRHTSTVWKSTDDGASFTETNTDVVGGYCTGQCWYDNEIRVDPTDPNIVYALGLWNYSTASGGIFRSMDGGQSWVDLGYHQHPDYHSMAIRRDDPSYIVVGNDGGVWSSKVRGGRMNGESYTQTVWSNLNAKFTPQGQVQERFGLQVTQFSSIGQHPTNVNRLYGGSQDNGTERKSLSSNTWVDIASGDGGQVIVDQDNPNYVYGTYYNISPYRFDDGMLGAFGTNLSITQGITTADRSNFYIPFIMDPEFSERLYLASFRVYRSDNRGDQWQAISRDLTSGCTSAATSPTNYACVINALGATAGSPALYVGTGDGRMWVTRDAYAAKPVWQRLDKDPLPLRPVSTIAVDASNDRVAYVGYGGFDLSTPTQPGHLFKTTDRGQTWTNITGNLPDVPLNSVILDGSDPQTLYAGTDVGPLVTHDGGATWAPLGSGHPMVADQQIHLNTYTRQIAVGTHGRGAWVLRDPDTKVPALRLRAFASQVPAGPGSLVTYTLQVSNKGNAAATGVELRDPLPANTSFVASSAGGSLAGNAVQWSGQAVPVSGTLAVSFTVRVNVGAGIQPGSVITNDGMTVTSAENVGATGSALDIVLAPEAAVVLSPADQMDGARPGQTLQFLLSLENRGYKPSAFDLAAISDSWPATVWDAGFTTQLARSPVVQPGQHFRFGVRVTLPEGAGDLTRAAIQVTATSTVDPQVSGSAQVTAVAVTDPVLIINGSGAVDEGPEADKPFALRIYEEAVSESGYAYDTWDVHSDGSPPAGFMAAHDAVIWYTGEAYPGPIIPYEPLMAQYLDGGGNLFVSGMDLLDQAAGTTDFVHDYLHVDWDGSERQNDKGTKYVTGVTANPVTTGLGQLPVDVKTVYSNDFSNQITPISPAIAAFTDDKAETDALTVTDGPYKVMFLAWPFEALTRAEDRTEVMGRALKYFEVKPRYGVYLPILLNNPPTSPW